MEPVMLHNPLDTKFEVMSGGVVYIFEPRQNRIVLGEVARQILRNQNTPLMIVEAVAKEVPSDKPEIKEDEAVDYSTMSYKELRTIASAKGIFKVGMKQKDLLELLNGQK